MRRSRCVRVRSLARMAPAPPAAWSFSSSSSDSASFSAGATIGRVPPVSLFCHTLISFLCCTIISLFCQPNPPQSARRSSKRLMTGLKKLESVPFFQRDLIQHARSDVEIARVYANREFFDNFEAIVENDAKWAYRFQRRFDEQLKDRDDVYLEIRDSEARRKRKGLPPRVVILPNWDLSDEDRLDSQLSAKRKNGRKKRRRKHSSSSAGQKRTDRASEA